jgi:hypothetical protein
MLASASNALLVRVATNACRAAGALWNTVRAAVEKMRSALDGTASETGPMRCLRRERLGGMCYGKRTRVRNPLHKHVLPGCRGHPGGHH